MVNIIARSAVNISEKGSLKIIQLFPIILPESKRSELELGVENMIALGQKNFIHD